MTNGKPPLEITSIDSWYEDYEVVTLPSGKRVGLRQLDLLHILENSDVPNFLLEQISSGMGSDKPPGSTNSTTEQPETPDVSFDDMKDFKKFLDKLVLACWVSPPVTTDQAKIDAREAIGLHMISIEDKSALIPYLMGGQAAIDSAATFRPEQTKNVATPSKGKVLRKNTK